MLQCKIQDTGSRSLRMTKLSQGFFLLLLYRYFSIIFKVLLEAFNSYITVSSVRNTVSEKLHWTACLDQERCIFIKQLCNLWIYYITETEGEKIECPMVMEGAKIRKNNHTKLKNTSLVHCYNSICYYRYGTALLFLCHFSKLSTQSVRKGSSIMRTFHCGRGWSVRK